jgi:hypothetical protein
MKKNFMLLILMFISIFFFYGIAMADGGGPENPGSDCDCFEQQDVQPTSGPFLWGTFTVARDRETFGVPPSGDFGSPDPYDHFNVHVTLRRFGEVHLFHTFRRVPDGISDGLYNLCDLTDAELKEAYERLACDLEVEQAFGLTGTPVLVSLKVKQDECFVPTSGGDSPEQMIKGTILLRIVPTLSCDDPS